MTAGCKRGEDGVKVASFNGGEERKDTAFSVTSGEGAPQLDYAMCLCFQGQMSCRY